MNGNDYALEALRMVSDWAKWLVTIETFAIALLGTLLTKYNKLIHRKSQIYAIAAILCFVISICFAAMLLLTLPEIVIYIKPGISIWHTTDVIIGNICGFNTEVLISTESIFFGWGIMFSAATIISIVWSEKEKISKKENDD